MANGLPRTQARAKLDLDDRVWLLEDDVDKHDQRDDERFAGMAAKIDAAVSSMRKEARANTMAIIGALTAAVVALFVLVLQVKGGS